MDTLKNKVTPQLCIIADQLLSAVSYHSDEPDNMQRHAIEVCIRHLDVDGEGLHAAHAVLVDAITHATNRPMPETRPEVGLCVLLTMALEHPNVAKYWAHPVANGGKVH